jgi:hypothetical protein
MLTSIADIINLIIFSVAKLTCYRTQKKKTQENIIFIKFQIFTLFGDINDFSLQRSLVLSNLMEYNRICDNSAMQL